jgi:hypothetical protein
MPMSFLRTLTPVSAIILAFTYLTACSSDGDDDGSGGKSNGGSSAGGSAGTANGGTTGGGGGTSGTGGSSNCDPPCTGDEICTLCMGQTEYGCLPSDISCSP